MSPASYQLATFVHVHVFIDCRKLNESTNKIDRQALAKAMWFCLKQTQSQIQMKTTINYNTFNIIAWAPDLKDRDGSYLTEISDKQLYNSTAFVTPRQFLDAELLLDKMFK